MTDDYRSTSCYPDGLAPSRRSFLAVLAAAAAGAAVPSISHGEAAVPIAGTDGVVHLNYNENPLGPSPAAIAAILESGLTEANRYADIDGIIEAVARHVGMPTGNVLVGCGSTEFLQFTPWAFLKDRGSMVLPTPTYGWSGGVARTMGRRVVEVPLGRSGVVDSERLRKAIRRDTRIVYLANPNNPTGASIPHEEVVALVEALPRGAILMLDEAYHEFLSDSGRSLELVRQDAPVLVLRTFSKAYGLAGLRLGYAVASFEVLAQLRTVWWGDLGLNTSARIGGPAALADSGHVKRYIETIDSGLAQLRSGLKGLGFDPYPHRAPFLMVDFGRSTDALVRALLEQRFLVRPGRIWGMPTCMRVSVGTAVDNAAFLSAIQQLTA